MTQLRVVIIDDDRQRREMIREILPDYMVSVAVGAGEGAIDYLKPDADGNIPDLVILNGDDSKSVGLYIYDWMINKSPDGRIAGIPVIVLTDDEFSDRCLEFLELGDVEFYEGEIDESSLFSLINDVIEASEFSPEPEEPSYEETKSIDRLMGHSVKAPGEIGKQRAIVLDMETQLSNLEAALERGRKRASDIRTLIDAAQNKKQEKNSSHSRKVRPDNKEQEETVRKMTHFLDKAKKHVEALSEAADPVGALRQKAMSNPHGALGAQGTIRVEERPKSPSDAPASVGKKTIVLVDEDLKTRKLCSLFLTQNYNVIPLDSGIRTVDYFVKNHADLLIINPMMNGMDGRMTVSSVHMQPGCSTVPVMYLVGDDFTGDRSQLLGNYIVGILNKPIKREVIAQAVDGFFGTTV